MKTQSISELPLYNRYQLYITVMTTTSTKVIWSKMESLLISIPGWPQFRGKKFKYLQVPFCRHIPAKFYHVMLEYFKCFWHHIKTIKSIITQSFALLTCNHLFRYSMQAEYLCWAQWALAQYSSSCLLQTLMLLMLPTESMWSQTILTSW